MELRALDVAGAQGWMVDRQNATWVLDIGDSISHTDWKLAVGVCYVGHPTADLRNWDGLPHLDNRWVAPCHEHYPC